jgi:hypothetical protein
LAFASHYQPFPEVCLPLSIIGYTTLKLTIIKTLGILVFFGTSHSNTQCSTWWYKKCFRSLNGQSFYIWSSKAVTVSLFCPSTLGPDKRNSTNLSLMVLTIYSCPVGGWHPFLLMRYELRSPKEVQS